MLNLFPREIFLGRRNRISDRSTQKREVLSTIILIGSEYPPQFGLLYGAGPAYAIGNLGTTCCSQFDSNA